MRLGGVEATTIEGSKYTFNVSADLTDGSTQVVKTLEITGENFPTDEEIGITGQQNCEASISQLTYGDPTTIKGAITRVTPDGNASCQLTLALGSIVQIEINYSITYPPTEPEVTSVKFGNLSPSTQVGNRYTFQGLQIDLNNVSSLSDTLLIRGERLPSDALTVRTQTGCAASLNALTYEDPTTQKGAIVTVTPSSGVSSCSVEIAYGDIAIVVLQCSVVPKVATLQSVYFDDQRLVFQDGSWLKDWGAVDSGYVGGWSVRCYFTFDSLPDTRVLISRAFSYVEQYYNETTHETIVNATYGEMQIVDNSVVFDVSFPSIAELPNWTQAGYEIDLQIGSEVVVCVCFGYKS